MTEISERLREAAKAGSEVGLKALLREPGCNALAQDGYGRTALMDAALRGHEGCIRLLLPVSNALAKDRNGLTALMGAAAHGHEKCIGLLLAASDALAKDREGRTASMWARICVYEGLARFIEDYSQAQNERADLGIATSPGVPRGRAAPRM